MPTNATLTAAQLIQLAADFNSLGNLARSILNNPTITLDPDVSNAIASDLTSLSNIAANLATWGAQVAFADSDAAFNTISSATQSANATVNQLKSTVSKINSIVNIFGAAVVLGVTFGSGNFVSVITAAGKLGDAIASA